MTANLCNDVPMNIKRIAATVSFIASMAGCVVGALHMHESMNGAYVPAKWDKTVITVDDAQVAQIAKVWDSPVEIIFSKENADIRVTRGAEVHDMGAGEATTVREGDTIVSCEVTLEPGVTTAMITHEIGHCLGLHHEHHMAGTNMYRAAEFYNEGWSDTVTDFDRSNLRALYAK